MRQKPFIAFLIALLVIASGVSTDAQTTQQIPINIAYIVSMPKPHTHLLEVDVEVKRPADAKPPMEELLVMPVWTPGSYLVREYARHVQDFSSTDDGGHSIKWEKINKDTWRIVTNGAHDWHASYRVYANELTVRTNELNSGHAFWNNAALLMYLDGSLKTPSTVQVLAPDVWKVATGLPILPGKKNTFRAENFDVLYDSPFEVSAFKTLSFTVQGVPHRIVIDGEGNYDPERIRRDVQKIVEAEITLMGGEIPYRDYTFILHLRSTGGGGLEHLNSTALGFPRFNFQPERNYRGFLSLVSHEFFHLWNVKRIRPDALGPFDYTKENYTKLLCVAEGITDYYSHLILRRAGLISDKDFLADIAMQFQGLQNTPGRLRMSAEEASFDSWIKYYRQDENSINSSMSDYSKGELLGLLLDLDIRRRTHGAKSLDDVMRYLYNEFYKKGRNYTPADVQKACELMSGASLDQFFACYVRGREELPYDDMLQDAGLRLETMPMVLSLPLKAFLGADLEDKPDGDLIVI